MHIAHIAIWSVDIETLREFYINFFGAQSGEMYINSKSGFKSYLLVFERGPQVEIMNLPVLNSEITNQNVPMCGYAHVAFSVGSKERVNDLTNHLQEAGYKLLNGPRITGDGYYESVILDPDGNQIEITI